MRAAWGAPALQAVLLLGSAPAAWALPTPAPSAAPSPATLTRLPAGSPLLLVLDDGFSSRTARPNAVVRFHLKEPLIVGDVTIAPASASGTLTVIGAHKAKAPDQDGAVQIALSPLRTQRYGILPIRPIHEYLTIEHTAGQLSTRSGTDTAGDVFVPGYVIFQVFRHGKDVVLPTGSVLKVLTAATIDATNPAAVVVATPAPFKLSGEAIHADFMPIPLYTLDPLESRTKNIDKR